MGHADFLAKVPLFQDLNREVLQRLGSGCKEELLPRGEYVFQEGDTNDLCYVVRQGAVKLFRTSGSREIILDILIERDILVEMTRLQQNQPRLTSAQALDRTAILTFKRSEFLALLENQPSLTFRLLEHMEQRLHDASAHIENLALLDSRHRVLRTLWWIFNKYSIAGPGDLRVAFRLTHRLLAGLSGTTRETVTRVLLELQDDHVLGFEGRSITAIAYPRKLQQLLDATAPPENKQSVEQAEP